MIDDIPFDDFWSKYPRRQDKKKAKKKWESLPKKTKVVIMADIETRFVGVEKQFTPLPTTYMNGERWEDEKLEPLKKMPRTNQEWEDEGKKLGVLPRRGETYPDYKDRISAAMRS